VRVAPGATLGEVVTQLRERARGAVLVEDERGIVGVFTERDLMTRVDHADPSWWTRPVREVMTSSPRTVHADQPIEDVVNLMLTGNYRHLPIVDDANTVIGIVSIRDVLAHIAGFFPADFVNLPPDPAREAKAPWGG
jgi:CBS domain-containing protein